MLDRKVILHTLQKRKHVKRLKQQLLAQGSGQRFSASKETYCLKVSAVLSGSQELLRGQGKMEIGFAFSTAR